MTREDSSVTTTLRELQSLEEERRREQVFLARRRQLESEQLALAEERDKARLAEQESERLAAEVHRQMQEDWERNARAEALRAAECERVRAEHEAQTRLLISEAELSHQRSIRQDRASQLEGRVRLLSALLITTVVGAMALWLGVIRPESERQRRAFLELSEGSERRMNEQTRVHRQLEQRLVEADERIASITRKLENTERALAEANRRPPIAAGGRPITSAVPSPPHPTVKCGCDQHDPLCACFGG